jgi:hypothetical protein
MPSGVAPCSDAFASDTVPLTVPRFSVVSCADRRVTHESVVPRSQALTMQQTVLENPRATHRMVASAFHLLLRT